MTVTTASRVTDINFLGLRLSAVNAAEAASAIAARSPDQPFAYVVTPNAQHMVWLARGDVAFRQAYAGSWLRLSDGNVVPRLARFLLGVRLPHASGSDVTALLLREHIRPEDALAVIGGGDRLKEALAARYGLHRVAIHNPPLGFVDDPEAVAACLAFLASHPARYIFFAVGAPRSEILAHFAARQSGLTGVGLCVGSSLLFATGLVKRAPRWVQKAGLEGIFRLIQRPRGHFRRVFIESLPVAWIILRARLGGPGILPAHGEDLT
jgi:N-acetylglucosaminyldiphosphoundecaprenol N-acetyl-beta-D-mannosaminyltransferase